MNHSFSIFPKPFVPIQLQDSSPVLYITATRRNNCEILAKALSYILVWCFRYRYRRLCLNSLIIYDLRRRHVPKRHLNVTLSRSLHLVHVAQLWVKYPKNKLGTRGFNLYHVVVKASNLMIPRRCYAEYRKKRKKKVLKCVPHLQHDYFVSLNEWYYCFVVSSVAVAVVVA